MRLCNAAAWCEGPSSSSFSYTKQRVRLFELFAEQIIVAGVHHIHLHLHLKKVDLTTPQVKIALLRESPLLFTSANTITS